MNRRAQAVLMLLLGGAIVRVTLADLHLRYVKASLGPFLLIAGGLLIAAGVMTLIYELRSDTVEAVPECADHTDDHGGHREPRVGWLLLLPVLGLLLVAPPALGSYAAGNAGSALGAGRQSDFPPLPAGDPAEIGLADYAARAVFDKGVSLSGRQVKLTGFLSGSTDGGQYITRMVLSCCAADARPIKISMSGDGPVGLRNDEWITLVGSYTSQVGSDPVNQATIPYIQVKSWEKTTEPKQPYE